MSTVQTRTLVERFYGQRGPGVPSEPQLKYLVDLVTARVAPSLGNTSDERVSNLATQLKSRRPDTREVSRWIDFLRGQPRDEVEQPVLAQPVPERPKLNVQVGPGVYELNGVIYVVKATKDKRRVYALRLVESSTRVNAADEHVEFDLEYARGVIYDLVPENRMTTARAKHYLIRYGRCLVCRRKLKVAASVERGVGPVCIKYFA